MLLCSPVEAPTDRSHVQMGLVSGVLREVSHWDSSVDGVVQCVLEAGWSQSDGSSCEEAGSGCHIVYPHTL